MKLSDFSSLVQLGVGLHLGSVLFEFVVEFASSPLQKKLQRLRDLAVYRKNEDAAERAQDALGDLETRSVQFFNNYRNVILGNALCGSSLILLLVWISVDADRIVPIPLALLIIFISIFPASLSLTYLWREWSKQTVKIKESADKIESDVIFMKK